MTGISGLGFPSVFDAPEQPIHANATGTSKVVQQRKYNCMFESLLTKASLAQKTKSVAKASWTHEP